MSPRVVGLSSGGKREQRAVPFSLEIFEPVKIQLRTTIGCHVLLQGNFFRWMGMLSPEAFFIGLRRSGVHFRLGSLCFRSFTDPAQMSQARHALTGSPFVGITPLSTADLSKQGGKAAWEFVVCHTNLLRGKTLFGMTTQTEDGYSACIKIPRSDGTTIIVDCAHIRALWLESGRMLVSVRMGVSVQDLHANGTLKGFLVFPTARQRVWNFPPLTIRSLEYQDARDP
uniref:Uncharacterized protein n=1 Tax=Chromera velia CCMP2878 TaxID=1169474 RepID=A0A0G4HSN8_9ALVE|eukprot:Cvel_31111.t1-p1 / transcript=Cvel_31111.t1 / gene=Cvel_31111 / organism=Chromera_velia_CCMP2878 / gene_product=hypothetical protein / transcript_product=hypothetical protein / location=Cvel_scaffold4568:5845-6867(-) / protein_length=226 / sequence_SO=supercontig / SO=protein_coding / is_pseudo=false